MPDRPGDDDPHKAGLLAPPTGVPIGGWVRGLGNPETAELLVQLDRVLPRWPGLRDRRQDLVHDGYLRLDATKATLRDTDRWMGFLRRVMWSVMVDLRNVPEGPTPLGAPDPTAHPHDAANRQALRLLDVCQRTRWTAAEEAVVRLVVLEDYEHKEVADLLGLTEGNCRVILNRARDKMEACRNLMRTGGGCRHCERTFKEEESCH